jgi:hypothetical protein
MYKFRRRLLETHCVLTDSAIISTVKVKLSLCLTKQSQMYEEINVQIHICLTSALVVSFMPLPLYPLGRASATHLIGGLGGPQSRSGQYGEVKLLTLPGLEL